MSSITTDAIIKAAIAVLEESKEVDDLLSVLKHLDPSEIRYERLRREVIKATSEGSFHALRRTIIKQPPISPVRPTRVQAAEIKRIQVWMNTLSSDNGRERKERKDSPTTPDTKLVQQPCSSVDESSLQSSSAAVLVVPSAGSGKSADAVCEGEHTNRGAAERT